MSLDLVDLKRLKITPRTRAWLQSVAMRTGRSQQDIARDALHKLAEEEFTAARVLMSLDPEQGHDGDAWAHSRDSRGRRK
jgi:hypothetical protein